MRILLVEDDSKLGKVIKDALIYEKHVVDWFSDGEDCEAALTTTKFDIILLDINLPNKSGLEILKSIRSQKHSPNKNIPILILTARDSAHQKIEGLNLGADDYLVKPFDLGELFARINALVRRSKGVSSPTIIFGDMELNPLNYTFKKNGKIIDLLPKEFNILRILVENIDKVVSQTFLQESLYSWDDTIESNAIAVHIYNLRNKIDRSLIKTIRGIGYIIEKKFNQK